jgi:hypothetical protein
MRVPAIRRFAAFVALVATLAGIASPVHAMPRANTPFGDMCVGGKLVPAAPASADHDCEACCSTTSGAPPAANVAAAVVPFAAPIVVAAAPFVHDETRAHVAQARAPPVS